VEQRLTTTNTE